MDITDTSFLGRLLEIFTAISQSCFVSFDLEFSGVPSSFNRTSKTGDIKQTLQQRYEEIKKAAERFQILQIGLTCVRKCESLETCQKELESPKYILQPYNFNLSPLVPERMGVDRQFSFTSGAAGFLLRHGFSFDKVFSEGVPYLSRKEAKFAKDDAYAGMVKSRPDIDLNEQEDSEAIQFMDDVRDAIKEWKNSRLASNSSRTYILHTLTLSQPEPDRLFITAEVCNVPEDQQGADLSRYQMRLVHQLVRSEFPELNSTGKRGYLLIEPLDETREAIFLAEKKKKANERITMQTGFRWLIEGMAGNDLSGIDAQYFARDPTTNEQSFTDIRYIKSQWQRAREKMKRNRTTVVGHNQFTDLIYLYRTFIGDLPNDVNDFATQIHGLFPRVIDTKYMYTHGFGTMKPSSSLQDVYDVLGEPEYPKIEVQPGYGKYSDRSPYHEAGFDAFVTAQVLLRLSTQLEASGSYTADTDDESTLSRHDSTTDGGVSLVQEHDVGINEDDPSSQEHHKVEIKSELPEEDPAISAGAEEDVGDHSGVNEAELTAEDNAGDIQDYSSTESFKSAPSQQSLADALDESLNLVDEAFPGFEDQAVEALPTPEIDSQTEPQDPKGSEEAFSGLEDQAVKASPTPEIEPQTEPEDVEGNKKKQKSGSATPTASQYASPNYYGGLDDMDSMDSMSGGMSGGMRGGMAEPEEENIQTDTSFTQDADLVYPPDIGASNTWAEDPVDTSPGASATKPLTFNPVVYSNRKVEPSKAVPPWNSDFWRIYANKLRVYGTKEEVCVLDNKV
ncbi:MAG: hypothetical protein M1820_001749 [Bogoriella megaspora]|nr:MAG: hypothetical protein M1820_001749 [Bogoriella megaspora]